MKRILVLGASGMAGHVIAHYFNERGYDVSAFARQNVPSLKCIKGDATDTKTLRELLVSGSFDAVINCIGILNQAADSNKANAIFLNSYLPHFIAECINGSDTKLIHMSTDCVFAGNTGPYYENSVPDGASYYDRTKALGEVVDDKNLTFRNSIVGPDCNKNGIGLFNWFMKQEKSINGFTKAIWTGVTTITLAQAMEKALEQDISGLYNLVNNESISKFNLLGLFNKYFRDEKVEIIPNDDLVLDKSLRNSRSDFDFIVPSYDEQVRQMKAWVDGHASLYPHYSL